MPNYDFRCTDCQIKFSKRVPSEEKNSVKCPDCGSVKTKQIFTTINIGRAGAPGEGVNSSSSCGSCSGSKGCC